MKERRIRFVAAGVGVGVGVAVAEGEAAGVAVSVGAGAGVELSAPSAAVQAVRPATMDAPKIPKAARLLGMENGIAKWSPDMAVPRG
ncbi:hypothetical protein NtRootA4_03350 [Arthrobacter sp. NtRootA4]|nr:hypothetical protein NtRootA2_05580 [Arthrobacter sp. NtRootA2]BCW13356.1 hypothetical protein NtRootA4_03350 [Arthrobacter sp. NtRootA4]BCW21692.1 hypothetical protein NtRootC7_05590 [Arthrobacter sp. NtRootC7]BCW25959.1 hypothetical protein NtRootC45_05590 [Arthrobacter sp. NtRootC45]BCW30229.1 hypothetical protein NtRootD5_05600 [Arthrobacter sp. NtRootD5]